MTEHAGDLAHEVVRISLAGSFAVDLDGVQISAQRLGSRQARTLLKLLCVERGRFVATDRIAEVLWPGESRPHARENVATLVSRLRRTLGAAVITGAKAATDWAIRRPSRSIWTRPPTWSPRPSTGCRPLQAAVLDRVRGVGGDGEDVLRAGAVLGTIIDPATLAALLDVTVPAAAQACERALAARLLVVAGHAYEFAHDLVREVLYATTPAPMRIAHHRRAADLLTDRPEAVGAHAAAAGDVRRAARAWLIAAENATRRLATADAESLASGRSRLPSRPVTSRCEPARSSCVDGFVRQWPPTRPRWTTYNRPSRPPRRPVIAGWR